MKTDNLGKTDPVCGMPASRHSDFHAEASGREFYFCSEVCQVKFVDEPEAYMAPDAEEGVRIPARPEMESHHHIPAWAVHESHVQRMQRGSHADEGPQGGPPDPYGEDAMALDEPPDELVRRAPPDDSVLGG